MLGLDKLGQYSLEGVKAAGRFAREYPVPTFFYASSAALLAFSGWYEMDHGRLAKTISDGSRLAPYFILTSIPTAIGLSIHQWQGHRRTPREKTYVVQLTESELAEKYPELKDRAIGSWRVSM